MSKAIRFHHTGGPEVLVLEDVEVGAPGPMEAQVRHAACGINFVDCYQRSGLYQVPLPSGAGGEGAGVVEAVGAGVTAVKPGDRVAYAGGAPGAYCELRNMAADRLCLLPEGISFEQGAAMMLKGMTVQYLIRRTHRIEPGETVLWHAACGVNFVDCYQRSGLYPMPLPSGAGGEGAGVVEAVGPGVTLVKPGDRVAYAMSQGTYCELRNMPADRLCLLPDGISFEQGAAMMLKGMTVQYLIRRTHRVQAGETVLWHAAAGGVGLIACQWLKALGAVVIGTAGSDEKCRLAIQHGADHCINYRTGDFVARVKELTGGQGVPVVYDSVGKDTFAGSIACLRPLGLMVSFGNASGPVPAVEPGMLASHGSLFLTRPTLNTYTAKRADLEASARDLFDIVLAGKVKIGIGQRYPLRDAARAHRELEARGTSGAGILVP
jgi:NADPH:quinone reductase